MSRGDSMTDSQGVRVAGNSVVGRRASTMDSQGVTLATLIPTGWSRLYMNLSLRWAGRYTSLFNAAQRFVGRSKKLRNAAPYIESLNFIHYGRWVIVKKGALKGWRSAGLPRFQGQPKEKSDHGLMLFMSNFDDEWARYVDTFMESALDDLGAFWNHTPGWTTPTKGGFEWFFRFVDTHTVAHVHYYSAFPRLATADIKAALDVDRHVRSFSIQTRHMDDAAWGRAFDQLIERLQHHLGTITWVPRSREYVDGGVDSIGLTSLAPFPLEHAETLRTSITDFFDAGASPFAAVPGTHFARLTIIDEIRDGNTSRTLESGYLLMGADADGRPGEPNAWLGELFDVWSAIEPPGTSGTLIDMVWGDCYGFGVGKSKAEFLDYIAATSFKATVPFADYPRTSLWDIHRALHTHQWFTEFAFDRARGEALGHSDFDGLVYAGPPVSPT